MWGGFELFGGPKMKPVTPFEGGSGFHSGDIVSRRVDRS